MSLFVINRYEGDEAVQSKNESSHLSALLKRIEERKRQRAAEANVAGAVDDSSINEEPEVKKRKKKKDIDESITIEDDNLNNDTVVSNEEKADDNFQDLNESKISTKKKKKKKEKILNEDESTEINNEADLAKDSDGVKESINAQISGSDQIEEKKSSVDVGDFTILGTKTKKKIKATKRVLPDWLAHPEVISAEINSGPSLDNLDCSLDPKLIEILKSNGITKLFPVQASMISWLLKCNNDRKLGWWPRDTCVSAPTGSGKTLAYVLPIVQDLQSRLVPKIRCLVVLPVQELATQVYKVMLTYTAHTNLKVGLLSGASSFEEEQNSILKKTHDGKYVSTVDVIVATSGRLIDHMLKTSGFSLDALKFLVIDEADRATDWLQYLPQAHVRVPPLTLANMRSRKFPPAQKLLFSATLSQDPEKLNRLSLFQPILFTSVVVSGRDDDVNLDKEVGEFVGRYTCPEELTELAVESPPEYKPVALHQLLTRNDNIPKALVFTNSGSTAHRLSILMRLFFAKRNVAIGELSAQLTPKQRENVLNKFATGSIHVLVSSDALARGIDIPDIELVVSYDLPKHVKGYIHRAGRTGRAGRLGTAYTILTPNQCGLFKQMLSGVHKSVPNIEKMNLDETADMLKYQSHIEKLKEILEKEKAEKLSHIKSEKRKYKKPVSKENSNKE